MNNPRDPIRFHPNSQFLSEEKIRSMEQFVSARRSSNVHTSAYHAIEANDAVEEGLRVPNSVLDDCGASFTAADEKRQKASTQFFSDTGLMALLCRHDRVLWLANMTSSGERQHYVLALIDELFRHLPDLMTVGILYDIGCQLHRSCIKWGFLEPYINRITFGISVFHAYGHQWPCQITYHPRKCPGFGLTDGEGCERFWSSIKHLIPSLRVSGVSLLCIDMEARVPNQMACSFINVIMSLMPRSNSSRTNLRWALASGSPANGISVKR
jgi:Kyakuja-Dileera-Zisupton transposase